MSQFRVEAPGPSPRTVAPPSPQGGSRLTERVPVPEDWRKSAACQTATGNLAPGPRSVWLYPEKHPRSDVLRARALCETCPVLGPCGEQPGPRVGVTAGVVYWGEGTRAKNSLFSKPCDYCGTAMDRKARFCSDDCRHRWYYERKRAETSLPAGPLLDRFDGVALSTMATKCGVSQRTVWRWMKEDRVSGHAANGVATRLGLTIDDIWGPR